MVETGLLKALSSGAGTIAKYGGPRVFRYLVGSPQERAVYGVLERALNVASDEALVNLDAGVAREIRLEILEPLFSTPEVQDELLGSVKDQRETDMELLLRHYRDLVGDKRHPIEAETWLLWLSEEAARGLNAENENTESPLHNLFTAARVSSIHDAVERTASHSTNQNRGSLPRRPERLVGRVEELSHITEHIISSDSGASETLAVGGLPGIGKTTTLAEICSREDIRSVFGDRTVWVSLGSSPDLLTIISQWSRSLGGPDLREAETPMEAADRLRAFLADQRILIAVDDVYRTEDAYVLKVLSRGVLLVSSRSPEVASELADCPENVYELEGLPPEDSVDLTYQEAPSLVEEDREHVGELAILLGGLPLFLKVASSMLESRKRSGLELGSVLEKVREGKSFFARDVPADLSSFYGDRAKTLHALLLTSLEALDDETKQAFAALGAAAPMPSTLDFAAAEALWDSEDEEELIEALVNQGLVQPEGERRFSIHPVLAAWAKTLLNESPDRAEEIRARHASHYMKILESTRERYFEGAEERTRAMRELETERQNILRGWSWAADNHEDNDEAARLCTGYPDAAGDWFKLWLTERQQLEWAEAAVQASRRLADEAAEEVNLRRLALAQFFNDDAQAAIATCKQALGLVGGGSGSDEARKAEAQVRGLMGVFYREMDRLDLAEEQIRIQIENSKSQDGEERAGEDPLGEAMGRGNLVPVLRDRGKYPEAIREATRAYEIYESRGDYYEAAGVRSDRGTVYHEQGDLDAAEGEHLAYRYMALQMNSKGAESRALANLGNVKDVKGEPEEALRYYEEHLRLVKSEQRPAPEIGKAITQVAGVQAKLGTDFDPSFTFDNCLAQYKSGLKLFQSDPKHRLTEAITLKDVAEMHRDYDRPEEAVDYMDAALDVFDELERLGAELPLYKGDALFKSALSRWDSNDKPGAIEHATHALQLLKGIGHPLAERVQEQLDEWAPQGST